jgi:hypothetical protein
MAGTAPQIDTTGMTMANQPAASAPAFLPKPSPNMAGINPAGMRLLQVPTKKKTPSAPTLGASMGMFTPPPVNPSMLGYDVFNQSSI